MKDNLRNNLALLLPNTVRNVKEERERSGLPASQILDRAMTQYLGCGNLEENINATLFQLARIIEIDTEAQSKLHRKRELLDTVTRVLTIAKESLCDPGQPKRSEHFNTGVSK